MAQEYIWYYKDIEKVPRNGYKVFTTFSCGGGSSMGYKLAGYEVLGNVEIDPKMNAMYVKNHHPKYNFLMGVQDFYKLDNIPEELYDIDVLDGSPPCSTFSMAGLREQAWGKEKKFREGQAKQVLSDLFFEFIKVAEVLHPKVVIAENVKGMVTGAAKGYVNLIRKEFDRIGYDVQLFLLNAATMGVPQRRERCFFICRRKDLCMPEIRLAFNGRPIPYGEFASEDYRPFKTDTLFYKRWCRRMSGDKNQSDAVQRVEGKLSSFAYVYLKKNETPPTLVAHDVFTRFDVPGLIAERDYITIQTFPQDYDFNGNPISYVYGMSVPPFMMRGVAKAVAEQLLPYAKYEKQK